MTKQEALKRINSASDDAEVEITIKQPTNRITEPIDGLILVFHQPKNDSDRVFADAVKAFRDLINIALEYNGVIGERPKGESWGILRSGYDRKWARYLLVDKSHFWFSSESEAEAFLRHAGVQELLNIFYMVR